MSIGGPHEVLPPHGGHSSTPDPILDTHTPSANSTLTATARA